ncbi:MAG: 30S ribosomal protein S18 [Candidatus Krumholzibacteria bacterium]|jgi:small subunit ribosomal protein S18|nr:30S ribosomal protein S18 [Candidatus Krumholzibacteria bacterium]
MGGKSNDKKTKKKDKRVSNKPCKFCIDKMEIDYKDEMLLRRFVTDRGKITPRRITGTCALHQRQLAHAVKRARAIAILPFVKIYYR